MLAKKFEPDTHCQQPSTKLANQPNDAEQTPLDNGTIINKASPVTVADMHISMGGHKPSRSNNTTKHVPADPAVSLPPHTVYDPPPPPPPHQPIKHLLRP